VVLHVRLHLSEHEQMRGVINRAGGPPVAFSGWHNLIAGLEQLRFHSASAAPGTERFSALTPQELSVLAHLAAGLSDPAISEALAIGPKTVAAHIHDTMRKLELPVGPAHDRRVLAAILYLGADPNHRVTAQPVNAWQRSTSGAPLLKSRVQPRRAFGVG
jgi:hypothetical protein